MRCWTGVRDGLQHEVARLGAALERKSAEAQDLRQEREVLRAKLALLAPGSQRPEARALTPRGEDVRGLEAEALRLRETLHDREEMCQKYKVPEGEDWV